MSTSSHVAAFFVAAIAVVSGRSYRQLMVRTNFVGEGSNDLAVNLLQSESKNGENAVFSPLGYNAILAIMAEGARGETRNQLVKALNLPEDTYAVRSTYKTILSSMKEHGVLNQPEFKSWFYVYKNNSIEETYKTVMRDNYLIDIKEVDRYSYYDEDDQTHHNNQVQSMGSTMKHKDDSKEDSSEEKKDEDKTEESKKKEDKDKSEESKEDDSSEEKTTDNIAQESEMNKENSPQVEVNEEVPKIAEEELNANENKTTDGDNVVVDDKDNDLTADDDKKVDKSDVFEQTTKAVEINDETTTEAISENQVVPRAEAPEVGSPKGDRLNLEDIIARSLKSEIKSEKEVVSALSANRLSSLDGGLRPNSRMIIFNALYFRGNWSTPLKSSNEKMPFSVAGTEQNVDAMTGEGELETGKVPELGATALDLPYQGERYSMLILLPDERDGLGEVVRKLSGFSFKNIGQYLTKRSLSVCLPKFRFYTISKPKDALLKSGVKDIFGEEADLSGITGSKGLYLDDLVQLVTLDVDESHSSNVQLTSGIVSETRSSTASFKANHPFMFIVRDRVENLVVVAGLVQNPSVNRD